VYPECGPGYPLHQVRQSGLTVFIIQGAVGAQNGPAWRTINSAVKYLLAKLNAIPAPPDPTLTIRERNTIIRARHAAGVSQAELARQFGISYQRVHQIVHGQRN
jgi:hypothetical protein